MYQIDFKHPVSVYFVGIGGISMSGLAEILHRAGFAVSGSDWKSSPITQALEKKGIRVSYGEDAAHVTEDIDCAVLTSAVHEDNLEFMAIREKEIPYLSRAQLLGQIMKNYELPIAVSGTHGKTTTTSMLAEILLQADTDPTLSIGGILKSIGGNIRVGGSEVFVTEACEYTNSFLHFFPKVGIILNIDADHLDFFKDLDDIRSSFRRFAALLPEDGALIINGAIPNLSEITAGLSCRVITYGNDRSFQYSSSDISHNEKGEASFDLYREGEYAERILLSVNGDHNVSNALAAIAAAELLGVSPEAVREGLKDFHGTDRRFEYKGDMNGVTVIDDYAHHPTEIRASLAAAHDYPHREIWCIFQPHTYTRTKALFQEFADALTAADHIILADIYAARETDTLGISSADLAAALKDKGCDVYYYPTFREIEDFCMENCQKGDLLITMGAGDVVNIGEELLKR